MELSYLSEKEQRDLLDTMQCEDCTPKPNQREKITFKVDELRSFFPKHYTTEDIQKAIIGLILKQYQEQKRQRSRRRTDRGKR